jgi:orotidine-5'-phosphate decarboxylase
LSYNAAMAFVDKLLAASRTNKSLLCIGLDPDPDLMPDVSIFEFNQAIITATSDLVCAYKPNLAFYEAQGVEGMEALLETIECIPEHIPVIGDAKRGDIGNTAKAYAKGLFDIFGFDAVTINPYLGFDSIDPFLKYTDKGIFILCRTSNPGAKDFQDFANSDGIHLYELVARKASEWNIHENIGLVVGATYPDELKEIRQICPTMPLLIPGVGSQGGDLTQAIKDGVDVHGEKAIINVSRQVLYASRNSDFAEAARRTAQELVARINDVTSQLKKQT